MKQETQNTTATTAAVSNIRVLRAAECPSLSGSSTLTYHVGCDAKLEIYFRVFANSSSGYFSKEWIPLSRILEVFGDRASVGAALMRQAYISASSNNGGFLLAALLGSGLVQASSAQQGSYLPVDSAPWQVAVRGLAATEINLNAADMPQQKVTRKKAKQSPADAGANAAPV